MFLNIRFIETYFVPQNMVYLDKCLCTFEKNAFCFCTVKCSTNVNEVKSIESVIHIFYIFTDFLFILSIIERKDLKFPTTIADFISHYNSIIFAHVICFIIRHINNQDFYVTLIIALKSTLFNINIVFLDFFDLLLA